MSDPKNPIRSIETKPLIRNTFLNLCGYGIPLIVAVFTIPVIIKGLGTDRFGILTLAWVLIGYLGLFDMGLGRALTQLVAEKLGSNQTSDIPSLIWTGICVMGMIGMAVSALACVILPWVARDLLKISPLLAKETETAFFLVALFVPIIITSVGFRGILDAYQRFDLTNSVRIPLGLFTFIAPLLVLPFTVNLVALFLVLMAGRLIAMLVQLTFCLRMLPDLRKTFRFNPSIVGKLLRFGGWMTVTNIVSPLMMYLDRFFIGAMISLSAVAYYATPSEVITKLLLISGSLMGVLFPAFSSSFVNNQPQTVRLFSRALQYIYLAMLPLLMVILALANEGLIFWLGQDFALQSQQVLKLMAVAIFFMSLGQVPYSLIQGAGRPDITAKLHLIELPLYLILLWLLIRSFGITGAAFAWMLRAMIDSSILYLLALRLLNLKRPKRPQYQIGVIFFVLAVAIGFGPLPFSFRIVCLITILALHFFVGWSFVLNQNERNHLKNIIPFASTNQA